MSLIAEHLFNRESRERLRIDLQRITDDGISELKRILNRRRVSGDIVNPHVLPHAEEPKPDFEAMNRLIRGDKC